MEPTQPNNVSNVSDIHHQHDKAPTDSNYELILNWYKINGKSLLDEEVLDSLQINALLKILGHPIWNDIYHCWAIELKHMPYLQPYTQHTFNPEKFTYFIEAYHNN